MSENEVQNNPFAPPVARVDTGFAQSPGNGLVLATPGSRLLAALTDAAPAFVVGVVAAIGMGVSGGMHSQSGLLVFGGLMLIAFIAYAIFTITLVYRYGQTFGKRVMGIRVVRSDGSRCSMPRMFFARNLSMSLLGAIPFLGYAITLVDLLLVFRESRQCLHDQIADTLVVTAESAPNATLAGLNNSYGG